MTNSEQSADRIEREFIEWMEEHDVDPDEVLEKAREQVISGAAKTLEDLPTPDKIVTTVPVDAHDNLQLETDGVTYTVEGSGESLELVREDDGE